MKKTPIHLTTLSLTAAVLGTGIQSADGAGLDIPPGSMISTLPFVDTGVTSGYSNTIGSHAPFGTGYTSSAGPDVFYSFTPAIDGLITIVYGFGESGSTTHDATLGLFMGSASDPTWIAGSDSHGAFDGNPAESILNIPVLAGKTYNILLDGYYANSHGAYTLTVQGSPGMMLVPEPGPVALGATALGVAAWRRRRRGRI